ncbi:hypothetical protein L228DRAFT_265978 [Xylona heveae TC161]|uniref:Uncharacterized protein n=1 Tax=Xylona heveae (strain CBS 132557 / TC161) TaxID=1328760 RepID=A0A165IXK2_XYLHT|nr:hypothetical protein L228DRAFT_265978 [Xylona heveae TC161]KZF25511.1 hypothetical protein L228DRAFT_265978 [Xylona heveae TC161]
MSQLPHVRHALELARRDQMMQPRTVTSADDFADDTASMVRRSAETTSSSSNSGGGLSSNITTTLPIVLAVCIPVLVAIVLFTVMHRRHVKKLQKEDANDQHKSLDFGMEITPTNTTKNGTREPKGVPEMTVTEVDAEKMGRRGRGMSMDMGSPYLLPPNLQSSRESLNTLSRIIDTGNDPYRPATIYISDEMSPVSPRRMNEDASIYSVSTAGGLGQDGMKQGLLHNAQRMSMSTPPLSGPTVPILKTPEPTRDPARSKRTSMFSNRSDLSASAAGQGKRDSYIEGDTGDMRRSNNYLGALIEAGEPLAAPQPESEDKPDPTLEAKRASLPPALSIPTIAEPPSMQQTENRKGPPPAIDTSLTEANAKQSMEASIEHAAARPSIIIDDASDYGDGIEVTPPSPNGSAAPSDHIRRHSLDAPLPSAEDYSLHAVDPAGLGIDMRRLSMGLRPLPPDDPTDNPEQRANRIRSFYKEYFDESKPMPKGAEYQAYPVDAHPADGSHYDPILGEFVAAKPWAEPVTRRAMTPPPRGPPRGMDSYGSPGPFRQPGPRAFSSASARIGPVGPRGRDPAPRKPMAPPKPLHVLPTPHLLKEDVLPIDFAPPTTFRDMQGGARADSPLGGARPYSPSVRAHTPLASSFDDLAAMPSPHLLRKSGTFTGLDFAAPVRFRNADTGSDAGSIRSHATGGISPGQAYSLRAGANRVSRLPKEMVGSKADLAEALRPQWGMRP